jgi:hypothetical protein
MPKQFALAQPCPRTEDHERGVPGIERVGHRLDLRQRPRHHLWALQPSADDRAGRHRIAGDQLVVERGGEYLHRIASFIAQALDLDFRVEGQRQRRWTGWGMPRVATQPRDPEA